MNIPDFPPEAGRFGAAFSGSLVALRWLPGTWAQKLQMLLAGTALSWYVTEPLSRWADMNVGSTGFFLGVFGMAVVAKCFEVIEILQVAATLDEWVRKLIGLPPKPPTKE